MARICMSHVECRRERDIPLRDGSDRPLLCPAQVSIAVQLGHHKIIVEKPRRLPEIMRPEPGGIPKGSAQHNVLRAIGMEAPRDTADIAQPVMPVMLPARMVTRDIPLVTLRRIGVSRRSVEVELAAYQAGARQENIFAGINIQEC